MCFSSGVEAFSKSKFCCFLLFFKILFVICYFNYLPKHVMFSPVTVCWLVCSTTQQLLYVFPQSLDNGWVSAHAEADERTVSRIFSHIFTLCDKAFFNIFSNLSGNNAWILIKKHLDYLVFCWINLD